MKTSNKNGLSRLVSFFLIAVLLIFTVGFAVNGWQSNPNEEPDSGENGDKTENTDENKDGTSDSGGVTNPPEDVTTPPASPKYISTVTGLEITEEQYNTVPIGFVLNSNAPLYGIGNADITFEFPIEDGSTRLLAYTTNTSALWKIGALVSSRNFISGMSEFFGGVVVSYGNDDIVKYSAWETSKIHLDLSKYTDCYYVENTLYIYTGKDYINVAAGRSEELEKNTYKSAPYDFSDTGKAVIGTTEAKSILVPYSASSKTELMYSETSGQYLLFKNGNRKTDMLTGKNIAFKNVFVLFANATTYEKAEGTELVIDTISGGGGYYFSSGYVTEIRWNVDESGSLSFNTLNGDRLTVNCGNAYFAYYKASETSNIKIS